MVNQAMLLIKKKKNKQCSMLNKRIPFFKLGIHKCSTLCITYILTINTTSARNCLDKRRIISFFRKKKNTACPMKTQKKKRGKRSVLQETAKISAIITLFLNRQDFSKNIRISKDKKIGKLQEVIKIIMLPGRHVWSLSWNF